MKLIYFAWLRSRIGLAEERIELPAAVHNVRELLDWLKTRGPGYAAALADASVVRVAVNQDYVGPEHALTPGDEVALFPPVTGG
ncbi:MAG: molybdopterin converting factor subunit 1 [Aliidongia sp.]